MKYFPSFSIIFVLLLTISCNNQEELGVIQEKKKELSVTALSGSVTVGEQLAADSNFLEMVSAIDFLLNNIVNSDGYSTNWSAIDAAYQSYLANPTQANLDAYLALLGFSDEASFNSFMSDLDSNIDAFYLTHSLGGLPSGEAEGHISDGLGHLPPGSGGYDPPISSERCKKKKLRACINMAIAVLDNMRKLGAINAEEFAHELSKMANDCFDQHCP